MTRVGVKNIKASQLISDGFLRTKTTSTHVATTTPLYVSKKNISINFNPSGRGSIEIRRGSHPPMMLQGRLVVARGSMEKSNNINRRRCSLASSMDARSARNHDVMMRSGRPKRRKVSVYRNTSDLQCSFGSEGLRHGSKCSANISVAELTASWCWSIIRKLYYLMNENWWN